ncbi:MAG: hypothetical protein BRD33_02960 [Bacteroidetes bacterium QH_6_63_17]|nr:MAG: hypothetical protein BRD33_02960 [Bacteroidetes bacterium QH_6_63_17]
MFEFESNQILLISCLLLLIGVGTYLTYFRQQNTLQSLEEQIEEKQEEQEQIRTLQANLKDAETRFEKVRDQWETQYKIVPETVTSPDIVGYLTELTQTGFETVNISSAGSEDRDGYSVRTFGVEGQAFFTNLYRFVWTIENNRPFYRVRDLRLNYVEERNTDEETGRPSMDLFVSFQMDVQAIYGAVETIEPTDEGEEMQRLPVAQTDPSRTPECGVRSVPLDC